VQNLLHILFELPQIIRGFVIKPVIAIGIILGSEIKRRFNLYPFRQAHFSVKYKPKNINGIAV
jgi:hypothetical protein